MDTLMNVSDDMRSIAYAYNLCVVLTAQIIDCDDKYFLQQVFRTILDNINLENFPTNENALCDAINSLLSTLGSMEEICEQKKEIEEKYKRQKKNAFLSAVPSPAVILCGGHPAQVAINALLAVGTSLMNYKRQLFSVEEERTDSSLKLEKQRREAIRGNLIRLFNCAWKLSADHPIPDALRLSRTDVEKYNEATRDLDPKKRYERLEVISDRFEAYPPFWFDLGETAREVYLKCGDEEFKSKALNAFKHFDCIHFVYLRQDVFAAQCAISHISLLDFEHDSSEIKTLLKKAIAFSRDDFDLLQQCVPIALRMGDTDTARSLLKRLTNEGHSLEINGKLLSMIYNRFDNDRDAYDELTERIGTSNVAAWIDIKPEYEMKLFLSSMDSQYSFGLNGGENNGVS